MQSASIVAQSITIERFPPPPVGALRMPVAKRAQSNAVPIMNQALLIPIAIGRNKISDFPITK